MRLVQSSASSFLSPSGQWTPWAGSPIPPPRAGSGCPAVAASQGCAGMPGCPSLSSLTHHLLFSRFHSFSCARFFLINIVNMSAFWCSLFPLLFVCCPHTPFFYLFFTTYCLLYECTSSFTKPFLKLDLRGSFARGSLHTRHSIKHGHSKVIFIQTGVFPAAIYHHFLGPFFQPQQWSGVSFPCQSDEVQLLPGLGPNGSGATGFIGFFFMGVNTSEFPGTCPRSPAAGTPRLAVPSHCGVPARTGSSGCLF